METIKKWIDESDVYCLILGGRYGSVEEESGLSYTQLEYEYALSKEKNVFEDNSGKQMQSDASKKLTDADIYKKKMSEADWEKLRKADEKIRISPGKPRAYMERGKLLFSIDISYLQKAIQDFLYAIFLNPGFSWAYYEMIIALTNGNDHTRAMYYAEEACRIFPKEGNAYGYRAYVKCAKKHYLDGIEDCNKAIELLSNRWFYNTRGRCYRGLEKYYEALELNKSNRNYSLCPAAYEGMSDQQNAQKYRKLVSDCSK